MTEASVFGDRADPPSRGVLNGSGRRRGTAPGVVSLGSKASVETWAVPRGDLAAQARAALAQWQGTELQDIVDLLRRTVGVDVAAISVLDDEDFHYLVCDGLGPFANPRDQALCELAIDEDDFVEIPDLSLDERTRDFAVVDGRRMSLRYFGSCPLKVGGRLVGRVCLFDDRPRRLDPESRRLLAVMARAASTAVDAELQRVAAVDGGARSPDQAAAHADLKAATTTLSATLEVLQAVLALEPGSLATSLVAKSITSAEAVGRSADRLVARDNLTTRSRGDVDLDELMAEVHTDLSGLIARTGGSLAWRDLGMIEGSRAQLYSVLLNLASHGLATSRPGQVPAVTVLGEEGRGEFTVRVRDTGGGSRTETRRQVGRLFAELNAHGPDAAGLATVARIVETLGGLVGVEDAPGGLGTDVWFTIPDQ